MHMSQQGDLLVIGVMVEEGPTRNPILSKFFDELPPNKTEKEELFHPPVNAVNFLPTNTSYYHYSGSLTTPPCTEDVNWVMMMTPASALKEQIDTMRDVIETSNRPLQPLNGRTVKVFNPR